MAIVYYYFQKWEREGVFEEILENIHNTVRKKLCGNISPSVDVIDSQSIRSASYGGECRGFDGNKKINGRK